MADGLSSLDHLYVLGRAVDADFHRSGRGNPKIRPVEHRAHGAALRGQLDQAFSQAQTERERSDVDVDELRALGTIIVLEGAGSAYPIEIDRLNSLTRHVKTPKQPRWLLLSVRPATSTTPEQARVWVADAYRAPFLKLFEDYLATLSTRGNPEHWSTPEGNPANQALVANISRIRAAVLDDLWTSDGDPDTSGPHWWELWLDSARPGLENLRSFLSAYGLRSLPRSVA